MTKMVEKRGAALLTAGTCRERRGLLVSGTHYKADRPIDSFLLQFAISLQIKCYDMQATFLLKQAGCYVIAASIHETV
jgi:hypothetical protein